VGQNLILIRPGARTESGIIGEFAPLTREDADAIRRHTGSLLIGVAAEQLTQRLVSSRTGNWPTSIAGVVPDLERVRNWQMAEGRFITEDDNKKLAAVCLIGETVRRRLFSGVPSAIGEYVRVPPLRLRVVGVLKEKGRSPTGADQDNQIFMPLTTLQRELV